MNRLALFAAVALLAACPPTIPPATTSTVVVPFDAFTLDLPMRPGLVATDRRFELFAGASTTTFTIELGVRGTAPGMRLVLVDGAGTATTLPLADGTLTTPALPGNVAILTVHVPPATAPPVIAVRSLSETRTSAPFFPTVGPMAARVTAFPITPGQPVDLAFATQRTSPTDPVETFFFSAAVPPGPFDVVLFGGGAARIADDAEGFPITTGAITVERLDAPRTDSILPAVQLTRFRGGRSSVLIAVSNDGIVQPSGVRDALHVRVVVLPVGATARLAFPSPVPPAFFPFPVGVDDDGNFFNDPARIGACKNWQGISPEARITAGSITITTPIGSLTTPPIDVGAPIPPVCYDGHPGTDFLLVGGPLEQAAGVPVTAAAPGVVVGVKDGLADNCFADPRKGFQVTCPDQNPVVDANAVVVLQPDGELAMYLHLKKASLLVSPGDRVACGQQLGAVGSAGDSAVPHLHFELIGLPPSIDPVADLTWRAARALGPVVDPYGAGRWAISAGNGLPSPLCP